MRLEFVEIIAKDHQQRGFRIFWRGRRVDMITISVFPDGEGYLVTDHHFKRLPGTRLWSKLYKEWANV